MTCLNFRCDLYRIGLLVNKELIKSLVSHAKPQRSNKATSSDGRVVRSANGCSPLGGITYDMASKGVVFRLLWHAVNVYFLVRSFGKCAVDRAFKLMGLAFLEPRRGLTYAARQLRRMVLGGPAAEEYYKGQRPPPPRTLAVVVAEPTEVRCAHAPRTRESSPPIFPSYTREKTPL